LLFLINIQFFLELFFSSNFV